MDYVTVGLLGVLNGATGFAACLILWAWVTAHPASPPGAAARGWAEQNTGMDEPLRPRWPTSIVRAGWRH
jgi:hypothetical protein